jgi:hypothetical protein
MNVLPPSSGSKNEARKQPVRKKQQVELMSQKVVFSIVITVGTSHPIYTDDYRVLILFHFGDQEEMYTCHCA